MERRRRMMKVWPLYLLLGVPAGYACIRILGQEWGVAVGLLANIALLYILLRPQTEEGITDGDA